MERPEALEQVEAFTYPGSIITTTGGSEEVVEARERKAQAVFYVLMDKVENLQPKCEIHSFVQLQNVTADPKHQKEA